MQVYKTKLISKSEIAENTIEFVLDKPGSFEFRAGQNINLKLPGVLYPDKKGPRRTFTISSAPKEPYITITTRMTGSGYKRTLLEIPYSVDLELIGPMGGMEWISGAPLVFIAGGIGITPFKSMLTERHDEGLSDPVMLFYSNKVLASAAYHNFFSNYQSDNFRYIPIITGDKNWPGEKRRFDLSVLKEYLPDHVKYDYYICGTILMVEQISQELQTIGIAQAKIHSEAFFGY
ncbi:MAG TPA: FAD-dependent oxidoreductase [bacterium]|nr:FAD-dependent oxidoreductase [bacterium]HPN42942.1 FAD-dependent oxidoreductase [bacterium]